MKNEQLAAQAELAASILRTGHPWERCHEGSNEWDLAGINTNPLKFLDSGMQIRLALATPGDSRPLHNPDNLTAEQVGAGWRLLLEGEYSPEAYEIWNQTGLFWHKCEGCFVAHSMTATTRVCLSTPWPEAKVEPWKLPEPPAGKKWHRSNEWTRQMLPDGYRPMLFGEKMLPNEHEYFTGGGWVVQLGQVMCGHHQGMIRTKRPLPVEPVMVPLEAKDVLPGSVFSTIKIPDDWYAPITIGSSGVYFYDSRRFIKSFSELKLEWRINKSIPLTGKWDADAWVKCEKEVV